MRKAQGDWWCPTCKFTIWGSKLACQKCGHLKPEKEKIVDWKEGDNDPKWDKCGPYSYLKGGRHGEKLANEPEDLTYPHCGCNSLEHCPERHHVPGCRCYTCRGKSHKW